MHNPEMIRYHKNSFGFWMCMLAIISQCFAFMFVYHCLNPFIPSFTTTVDVVINIIFLLFVFLASEKLKTYDVKWGYIVIGIGLVNLIRIYTYMFSSDIVVSKSNIVTESLYSSGLNMGDKITSIPAHFFIMSIVLYVFVAVFLTFGGIVTIKKGTVLKKYLASLNEEGGSK